MKASEYRKLKSKNILTAEVTLPSGAVFVLRRPPLQTWIAAGKIPQSFVRQMLAQGQGSSTALDLSPDETLAGVSFVRDAILYAVVSPALKVGAGPDDDELDPSELDPDDFEFLMQWIMDGSPGVPVATKGGEAISTESLIRFPQQKRPTGPAFSLEPDGAEVRPTSKPVVATG